MTSRDEKFRHESRPKKLAPTKKGVGVAVVYLAENTLTRLFVSEKHRLKMKSIRATK
jgi:hypothetical protein